MTVCSLSFAGAASSARAALTIAALFAAVSITANAAFADPHGPHPVRYKTQQVGEVSVFYREAGSESAPVLLLLHGFPSSSHMFRDLMPLLSDRYRVIAPDFPGFGATVAPPRGAYVYSFDALAETMEGFLAALEIDQFAVYMFGYGAPVGFRLALAGPDRVTAVITQSGNAYREGLTPAWSPVRALWAEPSAAKRDALRPWFTPEMIKWRYSAGVPAERLARVGPDGPAHDQAIVDRDHEIQLDLFEDYASNVAAYPYWQAYLRAHRPPVLAIWGRNDPFFGPEGARAFKRDAPDAEIVLLETGHFALETHAFEIAMKTRAFLSRVLAACRTESAGSGRPSRSAESAAR
ncbi:MAG: alpha/beta hydrolase [Pseudomonadota bacterium]